MSKGYSSLRQNPEAESRRVCREDRAEEEEDAEEEESWPCEAYQLRSGVANKPHKASQKSIRQNKKKNSEKKRKEEEVGEREREGEKNCELATINGNN